MKNIRIKSVQSYDVAVKYFIDNELNAPHLYSVVFLYCLKNYEIITNITQICIKTNTINEQVENALEYWQGRGLCEITFSQSEDVHTVTLLVNPQNISQQAQAQAQAQAEATTKAVEKETVASEDQGNTVKVLKKADYKPEEIKYFMDNSNEIKIMFDKAQNSLSKVLTHPEMNTLLDMHDRLKLPYELINSLLDYCVINNKRNLRYISGMAQNLADLGITSIEKFNVYTDKNKEVYKEVLKAMNATNPMASPAQMKIIDKWTGELNFGLDVILEACDKACINTSNPTLNYVDGILNNWKKAGIVTVLDVQEYETKYLSEKNKNSSANNKVNLNNIPTKPSNFNNFEGHKRDYDDIVKKLGVGYKD